MRFMNAEWSMYVNFSVMLTDVILIKRYKEKTFSSFSYELYTPSKYFPYFWIWFTPFLSYFLLTLSSILVYSSVLKSPWLLLCVCVFILCWIYMMVYVMGFPASALNWMRRIFPPIQSVAPATLYYTMCIQCEKHIHYIHI